MASIRILATMVALTVSFLAGTGPLPAQDSPSPATAQAASPAGDPERRIALVIGNGRYPTAPLRTALADAQAVGAALTAKGFVVQQVVNGNRADILTAFGGFLERAYGSALAVVYYAGHAMQRNGRNYLLPIDAIAADGTIRTIDTAAMLKDLRRDASGTIVMLLDASRPLPSPSLAGGPPGLAKAEAPPRALMAFAAAPGAIAVEQAGPDGLSPFAAELAKAVRDSASVAAAMDKTARAVKKRTGGRQVPWRSAALAEDIVRAAPAPAPAPPPPQAAAEAAAPVNAEPNGRPAGSGEEARIWAAARGAGTPGALDDYLIRFPNGAYAPMARAGLDALRSQQVAAVGAATDASRCAVSGAAATGLEEAAACRKCHAFEAGKASRATGPNLAAIFGERLAAVADFKLYSEGLKAAGTRGLSWDEARLDEYLRDPRAFLERLTGNPDVKHNMFFKLADEGKRSAIIAYLRALAECR